MAVLVLADVDGQTADGYDGMLAAIGASLRAAPGFIAHGAGPVGSGWRTFEVWETADAATAFFAEYVHPNLPAGVQPRRTLIPLHRLIRA